MGPRRTYILSVHEPDGDLVLEDVRTRRRARLGGLSEIGGQISRWREQKPAPETVPAGRSGSSPKPG